MAFKNIKPNLSVTLRRSSVMTKKFLLVTTMFYCFLMSTSPAPALPNNVSVSNTPHFKKIVWMVFENSDYQSTLAQPDFKLLTKYGMLFTNLTAEAHPSQGNYIAMVAGSPLGIKDDKPKDLSENHIADLIEHAELTWHVYAEDFPGNCFTGKDSANYVRKHNPLISFLNITKNPARCAHIENANRFMDDFANKKLANFSMYIPNLKNDGHDTGVNFAGKWLSSHVGKILTQPNQLDDVFFIITFDESGGSSSNQIFTLLIGSNIKAGQANNQALSHYSLLKLIEDEFGLGNLGRYDKTATAIQGIWK